MAAPTPQEISVAPKITLGAREFPIVKLVFRQTSIIVPDIISLFGVLAPEEGKFSIARLTRVEFQKMLNVCHIAITRADPTVKLDDLMDMEITPEQLAAALIIVAAQSGLKSAPKGEDKPGEEIAAQ